MSEQIKAITSVESLIIGSDPVEVKRVANILVSLGQVVLCADGLDEALDAQPSLAERVFLIDPDSSMLESLDRLEDSSRRQVFGLFSDSEIGQLDELSRSKIEDFLLLSQDEDQTIDRLRWMLRSSDIESSYAGILDELEKSRANAWAVLDTIVDGIITTNDTGEITSMNSAAEEIFGYLQNEVLGQNVKILMPQPYRREHDSYVSNYKETGHKKIIGIGREVVGIRKNGSTFPMELAVSEVLVNQVRTFTGVIRDISSRRELEKELVKKSEIERRAVGRDLHDGLGQVLTAISLIAQNIATRMRSIDQGLSDDVLDIVKRVKKADHHVRLLVRGLVPVEFGKRGFVEALGRLADDTERLSGIPCSFKVFGETSVAVENSIATHLFRIVQEASNNAVRHSGATAMSIIAALGKERIRIRVTDNGNGFEVKNTRSLGLGMHTMAQRAQLIGGSFDIQSSSEEGTTITCTVRIDSKPEEIDHEL